MVLWVVCRSRGRKPLIFKLVANLAAEELGQVVLAPFLLYYEETWWLHGWPFGEALCKRLNPLHNVFLTNTTSTLAAIAVYQRYMMCSSPSESRLCPCKVRLVLAIFWSVGLVMAFDQFSNRKLGPCPADPRSNVV